MDLDLSPRQKMTVASAITVLSTVVIVSAVALLLLIAGVFLNTFSSVFLPLAVAGVVALVFKPYYDWLASLRFVNKITALLLLFLSIAVPLAAIGWFFGALLVDQATGLIASIPEWWDSSREWLSRRWPSMLRFWNENPWARQIAESLQGQDEQVASGLKTALRTAAVFGAGVLRGLGTLFSWAVFPVYLAFFLMSGRSTMGREEWFPFLKQETRRDVVYLINEFVTILVAFFRGQLIIALLQGLLFAAGFTLVGLKYGLILGLLLGFLNIIPYLGSMVGLSIALPLAFFQPDGGLNTLAAVLIVFTVVQTIEGYLLTPKIMGDRTGLHPVAIIVSIFFWGTALGGLAGMVLAIPLTAFLVVFWRLLHEKYIGGLV